MKLSRIVFAVLISTSAALSQTQPPPPPQAGSIPQAIANLGQNASSRTEFSLDHSMLVFASKLDQDDQDLRRVIAVVDGVSAHEFRFRGPAGYDSTALDALRAEYHAAGWKHMVGAHDKNGGPGATDLW